jgi:hypothetical protein
MAEAQSVERKRDRLITTQGLLREKLDCINDLIARYWKFAK